MVRSGTVERAAANAAKRRGQQLEGIKALVANVRSESWLDLHFADMAEGREENVSNPFNQFGNKFHIGGFPSKVFRRVEI